MPFALRIAMRYLFSRKRHAAVNIISGVSVAAIAVATAALIIILSIFNGFSTLASKQISQLAPPLQAVPDSGTIIHDLPAVLEPLRAAGIHAFPTVTTQAIAQTGSRIYPVTIIGLDPANIPYTSLSSMILDGEPLLEDVDAVNQDDDSSLPTMIASVGAAIQLQSTPHTGIPVNIFTPRRVGRVNPASPSSFSQQTIRVAGVFQANQDQLDSDILIVPISVARRLLDLDTTQATAISIYPSSPHSSGGLQPPLSPNKQPLTILTPEQQNPSTFRIIRSEKWITFAMLGFILLIASFNIISTMAIIRIEKEPGSAILLAMGCTPRTISRIFSLQSLLITALGGLIGIILGVLLTLVQQYFGIIKLHAANPSALLIQVYPVELHPTDILVVIAALAVIGSITAIPRGRGGF